MPQERPSKLTDERWEFSFILGGVSRLTNVADALYGSGCDDALLSTCGPTTLLEFVREAPTLDDAVASAMSDVERANAGVAVLRVEAKDPKEDL